MTTGNGRWARFGKASVVVAFVTAFAAGAANVDGVLSLAERIFGSDDSVENTTPDQTPQPTTPGATSPPATAAPQPEPPPATEETVQQPDPTVAQRTTTAVPAAAPTRAGPLIVTIRMGSSGKIGPSEYRAGATPGANVDVFDDIGQLSKGCYPSWVLTRDGAEVKKVRNERCTSGGITMFNFGDSLDLPGSYRLSVDIVTDAGQTGNGFVDFAVT